MKVLTAAQMAALERASEGRGVSADSLMENAGLAVARAVRERLGRLAGTRILVLVGPGNNGADGLVAARHLQRWGGRVSAYLVAGRPAADPKLDLAKEYGVEALTSDGDSGLKQLDRLLDASDLAVDAVLGTGRARPLDGAAREVMLRLGRRRRETGRPVLLALDLPTGLDADTGEVDPACPAADLTVALGFPKRGLLTFPGAAHVGRLQVEDIGIPSSLEEEADIDLELLTPGWVSGKLPVRHLDSHKGTFGHALVVAGSRNYVGAAFLASEAAVRSGAGLVTLAAPDSVYRIAAGKLTEVIQLPLPEDEEGRIHPDAAEGILAGLDRYGAVLVGCGLGTSSGVTEFMERLLLSERLTVPVIVDADGLNNLARVDGWWRRISAPATVTPHPGEMAVLTGAGVAEVQRDRLGTARHWAGKWGLTVALKGAHTLIAEPGGMVRISPFANPGLASGGTGDVLSGAIVGLMAQGLTPNDAACCGVYLHGRVAEAVRDKLGDTGMAASDLLPRLPQAIARTRLAEGTVR